MGGKNKKPKTSVTVYGMSIHFGICAGPVDYLSNIFIDEKRAWPLLTPPLITTQATYIVQQPDLFGGLGKEGGVEGNITWLPGRSNQVMPEVLAQKHGRTAATMPAYRGIASIFFWGEGRKITEFGGHVTGFYWSANSPYLPGVWCEVGRASTALGEEHARIWLSGGFAAGTAVVLTWWQTTLDRAPLIPVNDEARMGLTFLDVNDAEIDATTWSDYAAPLVWTERSLSTTLPAGTAIVRVHMNMERHAAIDNMGSIDDIRLSIGGQLQALTNPGAEAGSLSGWTADGPGTPTAISTVLSPHSGSWFFSGGNLQTHSYAHQDMVAKKFDSNPAHIIYECLTNANWGMGAPSSAVDVAGFRAVAEVLYNERFGLSMMWTRQSAIEDFISEVLDHIEATLFVNPRTGLLTLKLIRNDYDVASLPIFTPDNSVVTNFSRKLWGETINEIVVTWTNPKNEEEETVVAQDLANIEAQGGVVSDGRNYYGVRNASLAKRLAHRDLRSASTPLAKCDIEINRTAWDLLPGDVCKLDSPEDGIDQIIMRVGPVDYGTPGDSAVRVSLMEDVFALALADYDEPPESEWVDTSEPPSPADHAEIITLPYYVVVNLIDSAMTEGVDYPEVFAGILAAESGQDTDTFQLYGQATNAAGVTDYTNFGSKRIASRATLAAALAIEIETTILSFPDRTQGNGPIVGGLMLIEGSDETESEICLVSDLGVAGYTFKRGVLDTIPRAWPPGTPVWFVDESMNFVDDIDIRAEGETVNYKILPSTSQGTLAAVLAPVVSEVMTARPHLPLRPADVKVNGDDGFAGAVDMSGLDPIPVTWANRNRTTETALIKAWDDGDVTPESGQTTVIEVLDPTGTSVVTTHAGLTGTSFNVPVASFGGSASGWIRVGSQRDGLRELQAYAILCVLPVSETVAVTGLSLTVSVGDVAVAAGTGGSATVTGLSVTASVGTVIVTAVGADPFFSSVVLLVGADGTDGATTFTDESSVHRTLTAVGNAQIDTAQSKFGGSSMLFDGAGDAVQAADSADFELGTGHFTIECWIRPNVLTAARAIVWKWGGAGTQSFAFWCNGTSLTWSVSTTGSDSLADIAVAGAVTTGVWYHVAIDYDGSKYRMYRDGVMIGSSTTARNIFNSGAALSIGCQSTPLNNGWNGWIDEFRFTKGVARYASDSGFTVPTAAFPRS